MFFHYNTFARVEMERKSLLFDRDSPDFIADID
jgi:hypothetical protein